MKVYRWFVLSVILVFPFTPNLLPSLVLAGDLEAKVLVFLDRLPLNKREELRDLGRSLEDYINGRRWLAEERVKIACTVSMYLVDESTPFEDRYRARIYVSNNADIQYLDRECRFPYQVGQPLMHIEYGFDPLSGLVDFYLYLIIGGELDKLESFGGDPYFKKAKEVCRRARFSRSEFFKGWDERTELVDAILGKEARPFREMKAMYFRGLRLGESGDEEEAKDFLLKALGMMEAILQTNPRDERVREFLDNQYLELAQKLVPGNPEVYQRLIRLDPKHQEVYKKYLQR